MDGRQSFVKVSQLFIEHPSTVGETYGEHLVTAWSFAGTLLLSGLACLVHGVFPFLFTKTGSRSISVLYDRMVTNRVRS